MEVGRIVARLGVGSNGATARLVEANKSAHSWCFRIAAEKRSVVLGVGVETHVVACVFTLRNDFSSAFRIEGDAPLAVGIKFGLCLQVVAAAACGIEITALHSVEQGPSTSAAAQSELEHFGFAGGVATGRNSDGFAVFAHNHSMTVVCLLVTHGENTQIIIVSDDEIICTSLKARGGGDLSVGRLGKATHRKEQHSC